MYFSGLRRAIKDLEEKKFYDIALIFLSTQGYKELTIVDGAGDGGRDVACSRTDLRIQLSVQKDWRKKINYEATATFKAGKRHFIYITNRRIRENEITEFLSGSYTQQGDVTLSIFDLDRVSTSLSMPGVINVAYERLGLIVNNKITATTKEIATSNVLLFSREAHELRENIIESNIKAQVFKHKNIIETDLLNKVESDIPGIDIRNQTQRTLHKMQSKGEIFINKDNDHITLSADAEKLIAAVEQDYSQAKSIDIDNLCNNYNLSHDKANKLIELTLEIIARRGTFEGESIQEIELLQFISDNGLSRRKCKLYDDLAALSVAQVVQFGEVVDHIFKANTFDIFRALGANSTVILLLDSSVAMPMMFGLLFGPIRSRYGIGITILHELCKAHNFKIKIPREYLNEMASHGIKAIDYADTYELLGDESKSVLRASGNAYISHFSHIRERSDQSLPKTLRDFLSFFRIAPNCSINKVENKIESILSSFGIEILPNYRWEPTIRQAILDEKPNEPPVIVDHDASVCTYLRDTTDAGFIFATWDNILLDLVEEISRIYADTPARIIDFLSMASGDYYETEQSYNLLGSLLYCDERKVAELANKLDKIKTAETAFEIQRYTDESRARSGSEITSDAILSEYFLTQPKVI